MVKLYRKHANTVGYWKIEADGDILIISHATSLDGAKVVHTEKVITNKSGRTIGEQIKLRIVSRVSRMLDRGYKKSLDEANKSSNTNQLGLLRPMLAKPIDKVKSINTLGAIIQKKLDGHRCMITKENGAVIAYSRQGKIIDSIDKILGVMNEYLPEGVTVDGELYIHGEPLQAISSYIKRKQPATDRLAFIMYDLVSEESYTDRHAEMESIFKGLESQYVGILDYTDYISHDEMYARLHKVRAKGYEGLMLKLNGKGYEEGFRSSYILKVKAFMDDEFEVVSIATSPDGWGICTCKIKDNLTVDVLAPGTHADKINVANNPSDYIGRKLTVQFANYTIDGKPFQPIALRWHDVI